MKALSFQEHSIAKSIMGAGGSAGGPEAMSFVNEDVIKFDMTGGDINTPRGESAKAEVVRLRKMMVDRHSKTVAALAQVRFQELDTDKSGFLENKELVAVAEWVIQYFGNKMGDDKDKVLLKILKRIDKNQDGKLDLSEFIELFSMVVSRSDMVTRAKLKFAELDVDKSGFLEEKEIDECVMWTLQAFPNDDDLLTYKKHLLNHIDSNGDGKLDSDEFIILFEDLLQRLELIERARSKFNELDTDKSGMLEKAELDKVVDWVLLAYGERSDAEVAGFKATLMNRIDVNHDGKLSLLEFAVLFDEICSRMDLLNQAKKAFKKLDADGSGFLEKEELGKVLVFWAEKCGARIGLDPKQPLEELLNKLDANSDGKLSLSEFVPLFEDVTVTCGMWTIPE